MHPIKKFTVFDKIAFYYQPYSTKMAVFPFIGLIGGFTVKSTYTVPYFGFSAA